ncbi:hypothetical protein PTQ46_03465 [Klebsiella michiganensis]|uniref:hypothetical protein n=1 Tax=Klebsiella michiganensis TaxID=1134687 RepID=UPI00287EAED3|nr:hypothetical protein [Klebsiella michiganensis]MDS7839275.1 hypothetical protein [Klebsiella michiganensis]MEB6467690.1 hypothetical protein [Klebsiella michiganensis]
MTTDITELAQREKFEAWFKSSFHPDKTGPYIKDQLYFAWKAAGAELVEALEKAQRANAAQDDHINQQQDRIEQLEEGARQINSWRRLAKQNIAEREKDIAELEAARQRIAELESRTVKLPDDAEHDIMAPVAAYLSEKFKWDGSAARWDGRNEYDVLADRVKYALRMVIRRAAGIKVEAE